MRHARNALTLCVASGVLALSGCNADESPAGADDSTQTETSSPTGPASPTANAEGVIPMAGYKGPLAPGTYAVPTWGYGDEPGDTWPLAVVDVPAGYWSPGGWAVDAGHGEVEPDEHGELMFFYADQIVRDPCANGTTAAPLGPTAQDLATALQRQPGQQTSAPQPVSIGGHDGLYLRIKLPKDVDLTACDGMKHALWVWGDDRFDLNADADITHLWILDVVDKRMILALTLFPGQKPGQNAELMDMAVGVRFIPASEL